MIKKHQPQDKQPPGRESGRIFQPFSLGERFLVLPPPPIYIGSLPGGKLPLILGSGKAFGSGEHETTASCLDFLEQIPSLAGKKVLDFGCGTGILAIAAARLGAAYVMALDHDPDAVLTCSRNLALNEVEKQALCRQGGLEAVKNEAFDLILANIHEDIILTNSAKLAALTRDSGYLILSGILYEAHYEVKTRFLRLGFTCLKTSMMEEYCSFWMRKNP